MSKNADAPEKVRWWPFWLIISFVVIFWFALVMEWFPWWTERNDRGAFGDSFGVINALFSGLAFAGVICAILLQKKDLDLQRSAIKGQKEAFQKQNFESSFFQLLNMHGEIVNSMMIHSVHVATSGLTQIASEYYGRDCFKPMFQKLREVYEVQKEQMCASSSNPEEAKKFMYHWAKDKYEEFYRDLEPYVDRYFRHLYYIVNFVDQSDFSFEAKKSYTDLIRVQLSSDELGLLFYHGLSNRGADFRVLIEQVALFEDIRFQVNTEYVNKVLMIGEHRSLYAPRAYGESGLN